MKNECSIVKDLMPLYVENLVSDSSFFMEAHLVDCDDCRKVFEGDRTAVEKAPNERALPLKNVKKNLKRQNYKRILIAVLIAMIVVITGFGYLTTPQYVPYSEDLLTLTERQDGSIIVSCNKEKITGFNFDNSGISEDGSGFILSVHAWKTTWGSLFFESELRDVVLEQKDDQRVRAIFYSPNNNKEGIQIWGEDVAYHMIVLPRLALAYYLALAVVVTSIGGVFLFFFRNKPKTKIWIERMTLLPLAYVISHVITKGFSTKSYSMERDFVFILLVMVLLYAASLIGLNLYRNKKNEVKL